MIGQKMRTVIRRVRSLWYVSVLVLLLVVPVFLAAVQEAEKRWPVIVALGALLAGVAGNLVANVIERGRDKAQATRPGSDAYDAARGRYLQNLRAHCQALPLAALGGDEGTEHEPTLDDVYIALDTTSRVPKATSEPSQQRDMRRNWPGDEPESVPLPALDAAAQATRLVLLGDPGAGKSTFVRNVLAWQARAILSRTDPPPGLSADLLPMLINLRDLAPRLALLPIDRLAEQDRRQRLAEAVLAQVLEDLQRWQAEAFATGMAEALRNGRCVLVLDGLDEVPPQPPGLRQRVRQAVLAVLNVYHPQWLLVTCRVRSYAEDMKLPDFQAHTLAPFTDQQVQDFIKAWYRTQQKFGRVDAVQATQRVADLTQAARTSALRELAGNPMLLTTMALIHQRETRLPEERVCLYHLAVDILLQRWQRAKTGDAEVTTNPALAAVLQDGRRLRSLVEALAYAAHRSLPAGQAVTDLPRGDALELLSRPAYLGDAGLADAFLNYADERAGLLVRRGEAADQPITYSFPHRTFQEYLAGCFLIDERRAGRARAFFQHAGEGEFWGLAARLGAEELLYNRRQRLDVLDLAYDLCPAPEPSSMQGRRAVLWAGNMAALVGRAAIVGDQGNPDSGMPYMQRLLPRLVALLGSDLPAAERAEAGIALAHLGDPRFRVDAWYLPDEPLLGFVEIPAGAFRMGSDPTDDAEALSFEQPQHEVVLPRYYMARYPVTVAQFQAFVRESGHKPEREASVRGLPNHPVAYVSWHEALAYCNWLNGKLRQWPGAPEPLATLLRQHGWRVMLPSEAEWEKAARGTDGRRYPWGAESHPNLANYADTRLHTRSTVGCFASGASPYGMQDMSGNVWEWTRSLWGREMFEPAFGYPYRPDDGREDLQAADTISRVLRGGGFWDGHQFVRCAYRHWAVARDFDFGVGFRVLVRL